MKLVGLVKTLDHSCYRYRLRPFEPTLHEQGWEVFVKSLPKNWFHRLPLFRALRAADSVVLQRRLLNRSELLLLRRSVRRLVFDFDDAVLYRSSNSSKGPHSRRRDVRFRAMMQAADAVIAGNSFLVNLAGGYTDLAKVHLIPTCVDPEAYLPATHQNDREKLQLVWIGSASTVRSLKGVSSHLQAVTRAVPKAQLKVICDVFSDVLPMATLPCPWSAEREAKELASADIGISWMPDDLWSRGKCGLKVLQYMATGLPVVANPMGVHCEMVVHGKNGLLAETPEEWAEAVHWLARNPDIRRAMGAAGRQRVALHYSPQRWGAEFARAISNKVLDDTR